MPAWSAGMTAAGAARKNETVEGASCSFHRPVFSRYLELVTRRCRIMLLAWRRRSTVRWYQ